MRVIRRTIKEWPDVYRARFEVGLGYHRCKRSDASVKVVLVSYYRGLRLQRTYYYKQEAYS